ncbi:tyrosine-type recombinase/integrase [Sinorhizobium medicae]|nr:tyrosine-type recombinase/integrase [Sinorhizobium medicae]
MTLDEIKKQYPGITRWEDRLGKLRWRFQKKGMKTTLIPVSIEPGTKAFDVAYRAIIENRAPRKADVVVDIPNNASLPETFNAGWKLVLKSQAWRDLAPAGQAKPERMAREFLAMPIVVGEKLTWGDVPVADMTYEDLELLIERWEVTPSKPWHMKVMLKKIFFQARRKGWRNDDPTELVKWKRGGGKKGGYIGWKRWPEEVCLQFEARHKIGSAARTCYALAKWMGGRRGDIARIAWDQLITVEIDGEVVEGFEYEQHKQVLSDEDMAQFRPMTSMLAEALAPLDRSLGGTVLKTAYGKPFSEKSLTGMMAHWCKQADIPVSSRKTGEVGYTLHGLRKSYATMVAESGASFQQQKDMLGHTTMQQVALYAKGVDKRKTTAAGSRLLEEKHGQPRLRLVK